MAFFFPVIITEHTLIIWDEESDQPEDTKLKRQWTWAPENVIGVIFANKHI